MGGLRSVSPPPRTWVGTRAFQRPSLTPKEAIMTIPRRRGASGSAGGETGSKSHLPFRRHEFAHHAIFKPRRILTISDRPDQIFI
jgi:hypothetical protein